MKKNKLSVWLAIVVICIFVLGMSSIYAVNTIDYSIDLTELTYTTNGTQSNIKIYTQDQFNEFLEDYENGNLPAIYVTEFLFDGVGMVKTPDLDDFIADKSNETKIKTLSIKAINVNTTGNIEFKGKITGGMIAVNTNNVTGEINLILNGVNIDTDSKKAPAVYVYNKDITYTGCKVTIKTIAGTENILNGGKFKKVSLVGSDELSNYTSIYSGDAKTNYTTYSNYYGIYTSDQIKNILFAKVQADREDLADGDPYYFYKGAGAISSDIDLYFEGAGFLKIISKNKEGVETKGNLTFLGGTGDYEIYAQDDCLNTTTKSSSNSSARNALTIDVNSMIAIVDIEGDEGDAIDSNGTLTINGGTIIAIAHPGQDAGLDSETGTIINGGTILATGDMFDQISNESSQKFITFNVNGVTDGSIVALLDSNNNAVMAYKTDRTYTNLVYSSANLADGTYYLYKDGEVTGTEVNGFYNNPTQYTGGTQLTSSTPGSQGGMFGGNGVMGGPMQGGKDGSFVPGQMPNIGFQSETNMNSSTINVPIIVLIILVVLLVIVIMVAVITNIMKKRKDNQF